VKHSLGRRGAVVFSLAVGLVVASVPAGAQGSGGEATEPGGGQLELVAPIALFQPGADGAPGHLTLAAPKRRPQLFEDRNGKERRVGLTKAQIEELLAAVGEVASLDAVVRVPGAKKDEDAAAVTLSNVQVGEDGSINADAQIEAAVDNPILQDDAAGLDPTLPETSEDIEVTVAAPAPSSANRPPQGGAPNGQIDVTGNVVKFAIKANLPVGDPKHPSFYSLVPGARKCAENLQTVVNLYNIDARGGAFSTATNPACWFDDSDAQWSVTFSRWNEERGRFEAYESFQLTAQQFTAGTWFTTCRPGRTDCQSSVIGVYTVGATFSH
jgi:hypothetical protein